MKKTLLICGIGGPTPRSIALTIRKKNPNYHIVGIDYNPHAVGFYMKDLVDRCYVSPKAGTNEYWPFIVDLIAKERIDYAIVQPEKEIMEWGKYYKEHLSYPCPALIPFIELSSSLVDKSVMAEILKGTKFIPKTLKVSSANPMYDEVDSTIGYPCWIRATQGSGGFGSFKLENRDSYKYWLFINNDINEFTISEYLPGRHLANQMLYYDGEFIKGAALECVEYVMANVAPSRVTGNTSYGRFINDRRINSFCEECISCLCDKLKVKASGVFSFDLKEDKNGNLRVTEVNVRHMAYTGIMADVGFDIISDSMKILEDGNASLIERNKYFNYDKPYVFLRDVDIEPIIIDETLLIPKEYGGKL